MFRIAKSGSFVHYSAIEDSDGPSQIVINRYCLSEEWSGDLANGLFTLGPLSIHLHGIDLQDCGLLTLLRCYDIVDRTKILELLENASSTVASFCFSTHIIKAQEPPQPVLCIGESSNFDDNSQGKLNGIFLYPKMPHEVTRN